MLTRAEAMESIRKQPTDVRLRVAISRMEDTRMYLKGNRYELEMQLRRTDEAIAQLDDEIALLQSVYEVIQVKKQSEP